jgi:hypothetical protein
MKKEWIKQSKRDLVGLGGIPFFILVVIRIWILNKPDYLNQLLIAGVLFIVFSYTTKSNIHSGFALIILIFTSIYYNDLRFTIFASLIYIVLIYSLFSIKIKKNKIIKGILFGAICSGVSLMLGKWVF